MIKEVLRRLGPTRLAAIAGVIVSLVGFIVYVAIRGTNPATFDEGRYISGTHSFMTCYNADGKEAYKEDFPRGMWAESTQKYRTLTSNGKRVWVYGIGPYMCREVEQ